MNTQDAVAVLRAWLLDGSRQTMNNDEAAALDSLLAALAAPGGEPVAWMRADGKDVRVGAQLRDNWKRDYTIPLYAPRASAAYRCDYCGSDYTDTKFCCASRRDYLNHHGIYETPTPTPPAATGEDADAEAIARRLDVLAGMDTRTKAIADGRTHRRICTEAAAALRARPAPPAGAVTITEEMVEGAINAYDDATGEGWQLPCRQGMRAALTAALARPGQEGAK
jgi:hypothetical protein